MKLKKLLSVMTAVAMMLCLLSGMAFAADDTVEVNTYEGLKAALEAGGMILLTESVEISEPLTVAVGTVLTLAENVSTTAVEGGSLSVYGEVDLLSGAQLLNNTENLGANWIAGTIGISQWDDTGTYMNGNGCVTKLLTDVVMTGGSTHFDILDLNGFTMEITGEAGSLMAGDTDVVIKNGTIDISGTETDCALGAEMLPWGDDTSLTLDNVRLQGDGYSASNAVLYVGSGCKLTIKDSVIDLKNEISGTGAIIRAEGSGAVEMAMLRLARAVSTDNVVIMDTSITATGVANGIVSSTTMTLDNTNVTITSEIENSVGIDVSDKLTVSGGSEISVTADTGLKIADGVTMTVSGEDAQISVSTIEGSENATIQMAPGATVATTNKEAPVQVKVTDEQGEAITPSEDGTFSKPEEEPEAPAAPAGPALYTITKAPCENGKVTAQAIMASKGSNIKVSAVPAEGYKVASLTVTDASGKEIEVVDGKFRMPASAVTVSATFVMDYAQVEIPFTDLAADSEYRDAVAYVYDSGLMIGTSTEEAVFDGESTITRAQIAMILYRLAGEPETAYAGTFTDAPEGAWYTEAVEWAATKNIIEGMGDGTFAPNTDITVVQLAALVYRYAQHQLNGAYEAADWAAESVAAMTWCVENGVLAEDAVASDAAARYLAAQVFYAVDGLLNK